MTIDEYILLCLEKSPTKNLGVKPQDFRSDYLTIVLDCTRIFDEICRRSLNFIGGGMRSDSNIFRYITEHIVYHARSASPLGIEITLYYVVCVTAGVGHLASK